LVEAKRILQDEENNCIDKRNLILTDENKWHRTSRDAIASGVMITYRDGPGCKSKWNQVIPEFKCISDFFANSGNNVMEYWTMQPNEKKAERLPHFFSQEVFLNLREWYGKRPTM